MQKKKTGIAYIDITTGEFKVTEIGNDKECSGMVNELNKIEPKEILVTSSFYETAKGILEDYARKIMQQLHV